MSRQFTERDAIRQLQTYLRAQALVNPDAPMLAVDGIFDDATKNALIDFQLRNGLSPTGIADRATWELLYAQYLDIIKQTSLPSPIIPFPSTPQNYTLRKNDKGFLVATVQYMLTEIGIVLNSLETPEINGVFDEQTESIVKEFQRINQLDANGEVDRSTWARISEIYNLSLHYIDQK